jgi:hypothetical protein
MGEEGEEGEGGGGVKVGEPETIRIGGDAAAGLGIAGESNP